MLANAVTICRIGSFDIKLDPSWLIIAALITWSLSQHVFPQAMPGGSTASYLTMAVIAMLGLFASLLLHELAHSFVARHFGVPIKSITLFLFGGVAELEDEPTSAHDEFWIAIAGPLMSFALSTVFWTLSQIASLAGASATLFQVLSYLALINLVLALFNMVPAFPLDGGRVLRAFIWHRTGDILTATKTAAQTGTIFAFALMTIGVMTLFQGAFVAGLWQLLIGAFVLIAARSNYTAQLAKTTFAGKTVQQLMSRDAITIGPDMTLSTFVNAVMLRHNFSFVPVLDGDVLLGHIDQSVLTGIDRENWANTRVGDVFIGLDENTMVSPNLGLDALFDRISKTGRRKYLVVDDHQFLGVITLSDLTRHLTLSSLALQAQTGAHPT